MHIYMYINKTLNHPREHKYYIGFCRSRCHSVKVSVLIINSTSPFSAISLCVLDLIDRTASEAQLFIPRKPFYQTTIEPRVFREGHEYTRQTTFFCRSIPK